MQRTTEKPVNIASPSKHYRGSRKHVLDWTADPSFLEQLAQTAAPAPVHFPTAPVFMPRGYESPAEARLETFGPRWKPDDPAWAALQRWWLTHSVGANTPNWDIAAGCLIEGRSGLLLVEAKANGPELGTAGKLQSVPASPRSDENHVRIGAAIDEACTGWRQVDPRFDIRLTSHYQLANRLAFTWKLASLGIPVVLIYLGFTGDEGIPMPVSRLPTMPTGKPHFGSTPPRPCRSISWIGDWISDRRRFGCFREAGAFSRSHPLPLDGRAPAESAAPLARH